MIITDSAEVAFKDADVVILVGAMPRKQGMERKDLLEANARIFKTQGQQRVQHPLSPSASLSLSTSLTRPHPRPQAMC